METKILEGKEPTDKDVREYISKHPGESYYTAREKLRSLAYGGSIDAKPPGGYSSWGDYWKSY